MPVKINLDVTSGLQIPQQVLKCFFRIGQVMQHAYRIDEIKGLRGKRRIVKVSLDHVNVAGTLGIKSSDIDWRAEIDGPNLSATLRGVVSPTPVSATRIENFLSFEERRIMRPHVFEKLCFPLLVHLGKLLPLVTKTQCGSDLFGIVPGRTSIFEKRFAKTC